MIFKDNLLSMHSKLGKSQPNVKPNNTCIISAGELSGDQHAALLVKSLKLICPDTNFIGYGGPNLESEGVKLVGDYRQSGGVMGFGDVFKKFNIIYKAYNEVKSAICNQNPSLVILVDYADFNLRLAKMAYLRKIPVLYFIPPKVWAWRKNRISDLQKYCSVIASILPFEADYLTNHGVTQARYVGHPFNNEQIFKQDKALCKKELCAQLKLDSNKPILSVLIGSRKSEVTRHLAPVSDAIKLLLNHLPELQVVFVKAKSIQDISLPDQIRSNVIITDHDSRSVMMGSDVGIIKSGTSTLEAAFAELPFVCIYQAPKISEVLLRIFSSIESISLPNLILPNTVKELVQDECNAQNICDEVLNLLSESNRQQVIGAFKKVKSNLQFSGDSYQNVAQMASEFLNNRSKSQ